MTTLGEALIHLLEAHGVDTVFGIPGVHTVELYRGLAGSKIRHVTPRHEQGAGFMADGYARASGKPGVAFVITGPGLTNTITAMGQARADSVPMLVISGVNATGTLGKGLGHLHELPDQRGMMEKVALSSRRIEKSEELPGALADAFALFAGEDHRARRPGGERGRLHDQPGVGRRWRGVGELWRKAVRRQDHDVGGNLDMDRPRPRAGKQCESIGEHAGQFVRLGDAA